MPGAWLDQAQAISTGKQTIPFLRIGDIAGTGEPLLQFKKTVTTAAVPVGRMMGIISAADLGDTVKYCYVDHQSWHLGLSMTFK